MKSKLILLVVGCILGFCSSKLISWVKAKDTIYIKLDADYQMDNGSIVTKGSMLEVDKGFSEGFTRYILYLNISDADSPDSNFIERDNYKHIHWLRKRKPTPASPELLRREPVP
tara:strand:+ start:368 stop:709 length:342 start_codon:yes stop_codon:yes gene_type:complete